MKNIKEKVLYSFLFFLFVLVDQLTKYYFSDHSFRNYFFAFSLHIPIWLMYAIYAILLGGLLYWFIVATKKTVWTKLAFVLIVAGAISNLVERIALGYVRDFIYIHTGVFNLADFMIILGLIILFFI
ncbi:signal peptidase II [Patescibacteria group bacterium]|nr:signal peptidase II [Patescibacteria group bacterium]